MQITRQHITKIKGRHTSVQSVTRSRKRTAFAKKSNTICRFLKLFTRQTYSRRLLSLFLIRMSLVKVILCCSASRTDTTDFVLAFFSFWTKKDISHNYGVGFRANYSKSLQQTSSIKPANRTIKKKKYIKTHAPCSTTLWQAHDYAKHAMHGRCVSICCLQKHPHHLRWQLQLVCAARSVAAKSVGLYHEQRRAKSRRLYHVLASAY